MHIHFKKIYSIIALVVLAAILIIFSRGTASLAAPSTVRYTSTVMQSGYTTSFVDVHPAPTANSSVVTYYIAHRNVTVYAATMGQALNDNPMWYRVSALNAAPLYIFSGLIAVTSDNGDTSRAPVGGKVIVVSLSHQWLHAYQNYRQVFSTPVMSGRPALPSPPGYYRVFLKLSPTTFYSPFPPGSPYWYPPTHINYAMEWRNGGFFLHDASWHSVFGPGTNMWHYDPLYGWQYGSHGCVAMSIPAAAWLYGWTPYGTLVEITN